MPRFVIAMLLVVGIIHVLPLSGAVGSERLAALYGIGFAEPNITILMRHRAILFGLLGVFILYAAFRPALQPMAFLAGLVSVVSFLWLAWSVGGYNELVGRVVLADIVALVCLILGSLAYAFTRKKD
jgi:uncharacterized BrkB/YihY/UPF0761 family membrane protein